MRDLENAVFLLLMFCHDMLMIFYVLFNLPKMTIFVVKNYHPKSQFTYESYGLNYNLLVSRIENVKIKHSDFHKLGFHCNLG